MPFLQACLSESEDLPDLADISIVFDGLTLALRVEAGCVS